MTEKQVAAEMYTKGYRYIIFPINGSDLDPMYAKSAMDIGPIMRTMFISDRCQVQFLDDYLK